MPVRKIDTDEILKKVFVEKLPRFRVADEVGCSRSYITKVCNKYVDSQTANQREERLVELLPEKSNKVRKWVSGVADGLSGTDSAMKAFDVTSRGSAKTIAQRLGADPDLAVGVQTLLHQEGLGRRYRVQKLKKVVDSQDLGLSLRGLDTSFKLTGEFAPEEVHVVQYNPEAARARYAELKGLLQEAIAVEGNVIDVEAETTNMIQGEGK